MEIVGKIALSLVVVTIFSFLFFKKEQIGTAKFLLMIGNVLIESTMIILMLLTTYLIWR